MDSRWLLLLDLYSTACDDRASSIPFGTTEALTAWTWSAWLPTACGKPATVAATRAEQSLGVMKSRSEEVCRCRR